MIYSQPLALAEAVEAEAAVVVAVAVAVAVAVVEVHLGYYTKKKIEEERKARALQAARMEADRQRRESGC